MKRIVLTLAAFAGLVVAGLAAPDSADARWGYRYRGGPAVQYYRSYPPNALRYRVNYGYSYPAYGYPGYAYPAYGYPAYGYYGSPYNYGYRYSYYGPGYYSYSYPAYYGYYGGPAYAW